VLAVAGTVERNRCKITNSPWVIDTEQLQGGFGFHAVRVLNDFEALAWSLPHLAPADLLRVGPGTALAGAPLLVLGPGTGFGAACLVSSRTGAIAIGTEAGHATLPAITEREDAVIAQMRRRFGHVSIERALSGGGLEHLHGAIAAIDRITVPNRAVTDIVAAAQTGICPVSRAALDMFCAMLGTVAGDLALTFGARGGVFIAGGVVPRFAAELAASEFRTRFTAKGRFHGYLDAIPTSVILHPDAAFVGLQAIASGATLGDQA
jgi:glucokinase